MLASVRSAVQVYLDSTGRLIAMTGSNYGMGQHIADLPVETFFDWLFVSLHGKKL